MKSKQELELIKSFVDNTYNRFGQRLLVNNRGKFDPVNNPQAELGYCFKYVDQITRTQVYNIVCSDTGIPYTDFRIMMHEYGHIYLGHLDGQYELLDQQIHYTLECHRDELIDEINTTCGIDFAETLLNRVLDDPYLNHTLHNIAMDMEVNSKILSLEDITEIESDVTSLIPNKDSELLKKIQDQVKDEEGKKELGKLIEKIEAAAKVKLIHPSFYKLGVDENGDEIPFPDNLSYSGYLILIVQHLDQFVKMLVSIKMGGNGDTSGITQQDIQNALNNASGALDGKSEAYKQGYQDAMRDMMQGGGLGKQDQSQPGSAQSSQQGQNSQQGDQGNGQGQNSNGNSGSSSDQDDYNQGYQDALRDLANSVGSGQGMDSLDNLMEQAGMKPGNNSGSSNSQDQQSQSSSPSSGGSPQKHSGIRSDPNDTKYRDHSNDSRDLADKIRSDGQVTSPGGFGCGNSGGGNGFRDVDRNVDSVDMALQEVIRNMKRRVIKVSSKKDNMKKYNRGIIRSSVISPSLSRKVTVSNDPKIVFLIDISGSMSTGLIDRCLTTIALSLRKLSRGLRYDIITWNTDLGEHIKDIDPHKPITTVSYGGGTRIAKGIKYFKDNYDSSAILVIISDFDDYLEEWKTVESTMNDYSIYGFNYGYSEHSDLDWKNLIEKYFKDVDRR